MAFNAFVIVITYTPKYLEQQFGQSASKTNFLLGDNCHDYDHVIFYFYLFIAGCLNWVCSYISVGVTSIPPLALGMFLSGWIIKRFKLDLLGSARMSFFTAIAALFITIPYFALSCENTDVAGVTVPYQGYFHLQSYSYCIMETIHYPSIQSIHLTNCLPYLGSYKYVII